MRLRTLAVAILIVLAVGAAVAEPKPADDLLQKAWRKFGAINDYSADIRLDMTGDKVSVKGMKMKFYYKKPDRTKVVARQGFAAMPKNVVLGNPMREMSKNARATLLRTEKKNGAQCYVVQLDPKAPSPTAPSALVWIDKARLLIIATSSLGPHKLDTNWTYTRVDGRYYLPLKIAADMVIPGETGPRPTKATVTFSNYRVNKGISDSVFSEEKK